MSVSIQDVSLVDYLTPALKQDQFFLCLAQTLDPMLADIRAQIVNNNILARLSAQSSATLDFLAHYHFDVDVYSDNQQDPQRDTKRRQGGNERCFQLLRACRMVADDPERPSEHVQDHDQ